MTAFNFGDVFAASYQQGQKTAQEQDQFQQKLSLEDKKLAQESLQFVRQMELTEEIKKSQLREEATRSQEALDAMNWREKQELENAKFRTNSLHSQEMNTFISNFSRINPDQVVDKTPEGRPITFKEKYLQGQSPYIQDDLRKLLPNASIPDGYYINKKQEELIGQQIQYEGMLKKSTAKTDQESTIVANITKKWSKAGLPGLAQTSTVEREFTGFKIPQHSPDQKGIQFLKPTSTLKTTSIGGVTDESWVRNWLDKQGELVLEMQQYPDLVKKGSFNAFFEQYIGQVRSLAERGILSDAELGKWSPRARIAREVAERLHVQALSEQAKLRNLESTGVIAKYKMAIDAAKAMKDENKVKALTDQFMQETGITYGE